MKLDNKEIIKKYMKEAEQNAWNGKNGKTKIIADNSIIEIEGYITEPCWEMFSTASSIMLDGEILYGENSTNVENYHNEMRKFGQYETLEEALNYIIEKLKDKDYEVVYG